MPTGGGGGAGTEAARKISSHPWYHGTTSAAGDRIVTEGFHAGHGESAGMWMGSGVYLAENSDAAITYAEQAEAFRGAGIGAMVTAEVDVKNTLDANNSAEYADILSQAMNAGKMGSPEYAAAFAGAVQAKGFDSVVQASDLELGRELVVFDPAKVTPTNVAEAV